MPDVSLAMIRAVFAEDGEPDALLIEMTAEGMGEPVRLTSWSGRIEPGKYGLVSNGQPYLYAPFTFKSGGSGLGEPSRDATMEIQNSDYRVMEGLRQLPGNIRPTMNIFTVRVADPDAVETEVSGATIGNGRVTSASVTLSIQPKDFKAEPLCCATYVQARVPALF